MSRIKCINTKTIASILVLVFILLSLSLFAINTVKAAPICGDRIVDAVSGEQCDDGNTVSGDGCSSTCKTEATAPNNNNSSSTGATGDIVTQITAILQQLIIGAAFLMFVLSIFTYVSSGGDSKKVGKAKEYLLSAVTALVALLLARWFLR
jgi:cysteine-rich repeat protein